MIKINKLQKSFMKDGTKIEVLKGINLEIEQGESVAILGASGAGKSTLIHILGTLDRPTSGTVLFDGVNVFEWSEKARAGFRNKKIGFVFQFNNLMPEFNARENVMMPALIADIAQGEARKKAEIILGDVGLDHRMTHKSGELSGGEQQRVAVARALVMEPDILLADEPTGNLDTETGKKIEDILVDLNREKNITLIVVTHNNKLAERMSRQIGLRDGNVDLPNKQY